MPEPADVPDYAVTGPAGRADRMVFDPDWPGFTETVCDWLIDAPGQSAGWSQYMLAVVRLRDAPGYPPPLLQFAGATHELFEVALDPDAGVQTTERIRDAGRAGADVPFLTPVNIALQFTATDEEMITLAKMAVWGVVNGLVAAEPPLSQSTNEDHWRAMLAATLEHIRGGHQ